MKKAILVFMLLCLATMGLYADKEEVKVQVRFSKDTSYGTFRDALYFTENEYQIITREELDALEQTRVDNWVNFMSQPQPEPTEQDLIDNINSLKEELTEAEKKLADWRIKHSQ